MKEVNVYPIFETLSKQLEELSVKTADKKLEQLKDKYKEIQELLYQIEDLYFTKTTGNKKCMLYEKIIEIHSTHLID